MSDLLLHKTATKIICKRIFIVECRFVESIAGDITLKNGYVFDTIEASSIDELDEKMKYMDGNPYFEQQLAFSSNNDETNKLNAMVGCHFIVVVPYSDGTFKLLGSIDPYNPAQLELSKSDTCSFIFTRQSETLAGNITYP